MWVEVNNRSQNSTIQPRKMKRNLVPRLWLSNDYSSMLGIKLIHVCKLPLDQHSILLRTYLYYHGIFVRGEAGLPSKSLSRFGVKLSFADAFIALLCNAGNRGVELKFCFTFKTGLDGEHIICLEWHAWRGRRVMMVYTIREKSCYYYDVIMGAMASQITSLTIIYSNGYSGADQRWHQSSASLAFVRGIPGDATNGQ